jgi:O-antigen/teichoic acid export membrane protein
MSSSVAKNSFFNVVYQLLNVLFPLVTTTYVARVIFANGVGEVAYAQNIVGYFICLATLGLPNYGTREIAKVKGSNQKVCQLFSELFSLNFISTLFFSIFYFCLITFSPYFKDNYSLHFIVGLSLLFRFIDVEWFYRGIENFSFIAIRSFVVKILTLIWIFIFVKTENDVLKYAFASIIGVGANNIFNIYYLRHYGVKFTLSGITLIRHVKPILLLFASVFAIELYTMLDTTMIGIMCSDEAVGIYNNAVKIIRILIGVIAGIAGVLLPRLSALRINNEIEKCSLLVSKVLMIMIFLYAPCQLFFFFESDSLMIFLFGNSFSSGGDTLKIVSLLITALGFSNLFGTQVLLTFGQEKKLLFCTIVAAILNIITNLILIPLFAQNGAAAASVFAESIVTIMVFYYSKKYISVILSSRFIISVIFASICFGIEIYIIHQSVDSQILSMLLSFIIGFPTYVLSNVILHNPVMTDVKNILKKKLKKNKIVQRS